MKQRMKETLKAFSAPEEWEPPDSTFGKIAEGIIIIFSCAFMGMCLVAALLST